MHTAPTRDLDSKSVCTPYSCYIFIVSQLFTMLIFLHFGIRLCSFLDPLLELSESEGYQSGAKHCFEKQVSGRSEYEIVSFAGGQKA